MYKVLYFTVWNTELTVPFHKSTVSVQVGGKSSLGNKQKGEESERWPGFDSMDNRSWDYSVTDSAFTGTKTKLRPVYFTSFRHNIDNEVLNSTQKIKDILYVY